jgi:hypothetical protein
VGNSSGFCSSSGGPAPIVVSIPTDSCCLRVAPQYTPQRDPDLVELFADGMDYLLRVEKEFGSMGRWVATRSARKEDFYTQYHATYCAVMGLAECHFAQVRVLWASGDLPRGLLSCWCCFTAERGNGPQSATASNPAPPALGTGVYMTTLVVQASYFTKTFESRFVPGRYLCKYEGSCLYIVMKLNVEPSISFRA